MTICNMTEVFGPLDPLKCQSCGVEDGQLVHGKGTVTTEEVRACKCGDVVLCVLCDQDGTDSNHRHRMAFGIPVAKDLPTIAACDNCYEPPEPDTADVGFGERMERDSKEKR